MPTIDRLDEHRLEAIADTPELANSEGGEEDEMHRIVIMVVATLLLAHSPRTEAKSRAELDAQLESVVARHLGVFVTVPKQRDPSEHIALEGTTLSIGFLRPVTKDLSQAICDGGRWLLVGRLEQTQGAQALFNSARKIQRLRLEFVDVKTTVHPSAKGIYEQHRTVLPQVTFEISRQRAAKLDPKILRKTLTGKRCAALVRSLLDRVSVADK